jgi:hypothetical protein
MDGLAGFLREHGCEAQKFVPPNGPPGMAARGFPAEPEAQRERSAGSSSF